MVLHNNLKALCEMFLNGAMNELSAICAYPVADVEAEFVKLGWTKVRDSHGNDVFLPQDRDDDFDFRAWATVNYGLGDESQIGFGHH